MGLTGVLTVTAIFTSGFISEPITGEAIGIPDGFGILGAIFGVIIYGIGANVCYTVGWVVELFVRKTWPDKADRFATWSFALGLIFSIMLTLLPALLIIFFAAVAIFGRATGHVPVKVEQCG